MNLNSVLAMDESNRLKEFRLQERKALWALLAAGILLLACLLASAAGAEGNGRPPHQPGKESRGLQVQFSIIKNQGITKDPNSGFRADMYSKRLH